MNVEVREVTRACVFYSLLSNSVMMFEPVLGPAIAYFNVLPSTAQFLVLVALSLVAAKLVQVFSLKIVKQLVEIRQGKLSRIIYDGLHAPVYLTVALWGIYLSISEVNFLAETTFYLERVVLTAAAIIWAWAINRIGDRTLNFVKETEDSRFDYEFAPIFENVWTASVVIISAFIVVSGVWRINLTPLLASAGILGVVGGFAARDAIANFFGGLALYFDNTYKLGDYVVLDTGEEGIVVDIGIRSTDVKTRDDVIITVPNSVLNSSKVINESAPDKKSRLVVPVGVSYNSDIDKVEESLLEVANDESAVLDHPRPRVRFKEFGDHALRYELFAWIPNPIEKVRARHKLNQGIHKKFREQDIKIPFPQRTLSFNDDEMRKTVRDLERKQEEKFSDEE